MVLNNNFLKIFIFNCLHITAFILFVWGKIKLKNGKKNEKFWTSNEVDESCIRLEIIMNN